ncbi:MAG: monovalent cation/H(+) antiporter subunit G [Qingshengfaniella sp.]
MINVITAILVVSGSLFAFIAGLGIFNLRDVLNRMHASTKAGTLGSTLALAGAALYFRDDAVAVRVLATILFLMFTAPIAAHMIGRAAFRISAFRATRRD